MPTALFPASPPPPDVSVLDTITNDSNALLNAAVIAGPPSLYSTVPSPPPSDLTVNAFPFSTPLPLPYAASYNDVLNVEESTSFFSSPRRLDYSVLDNVSLSWSAPTFQLLMNKQPHGGGPILVDLFTFMQEIPDKRKKQRPELDDWLYFPPNVVPTTSGLSRGLHWAYVYPCQRWP